MRAAARGGRGVADRREPCGDPRDGCAEEAAAGSADGHYSHMRIVPTDLAPELVLIAYRPVAVMAIWQGYCIPGDHRSGCGGCAVPRVTEPVSRHAQGRMSDAF